MGTLHLANLCFWICFLSIIYIWAKFCRTGKKCLKWGQLTCNPRVAQPKRLAREPCPSSILVIYGWRVSDRIFTYLECQETCAGNGEIPGKSRKSIFSKNGRKPA